MRPFAVITSPGPSTGSGNSTSSSHGSNAAATHSTASNQWGPFHNATCYGTQMALVLGILLAAFVLGHVLVATIRSLLRRRRGPPAPPAGDLEKPAEKEGALWAGPTMAYAPGSTELAGAAECAICLMEFAEGDVLRVLLPACRHGFHAECVERWLASSMGPVPSCPVCRASCRPPENSPGSLT